MKSLEALVFGCLCTVLATMVWVVYDYESGLEGEFVLVDDITDETSLAADSDSSLTLSFQGNRLPEDPVASATVSPVDVIGSVDGVEASRQWLEGLVHQLSPSAVDEALSNPDLVSAIKVINQHVAFRVHIQDYVDEQTLRYAHHESFTSVWLGQAALLAWFEDPGLVAERLDQWETSVLGRIQKGEDIGFDSEVDTFLYQQMRIPTWGTTQSLDEYFAYLNDEFPNPFQEK